VPKTRVVFIELAVARKVKYLCDIVEKAYAGGLRVHIFCENASAAERVNLELWTWKPETFIPHSLAQNVEPGFAETVIIGADQSMLTGADILILHDPADKACFSKYKLVVDFAETYNPDKLKQSRSRYKEILNQPDYELEFTKLGSFLNKELIG